MDVVVVVVVVSAVITSPPIFYFLLYFRDDSCDVENGKQKRFSVCWMLVFPQLSRGRVVASLMDYSMLT